MSIGIIRNALTTTLALELEYREPSIRETGPGSERATELHSPERLAEDDLTCLLSLI